MAESLHATHEFPALFDTGCRILILGSFPSVKSRAASFYYMHPQNRFYRVLGGIFRDAPPPDTEGRKAYLLSHRVALWDVIEECDVVGSSDASIRAAVPTDVPSLLAGSGIRAVFLNGKLAGKLYEAYQRPRVPLPYYILPSTSPANAAFSLDALTATWRTAILPYINE